MTAKQKSSKSSLTKKEKLEKKILDLLEEQPEKTLLIYEIMSNLNLEDDPEIITKAVRQLADQTLVRTKLVMEDSRWIQSVKKINDFGFKPNEKNKGKPLWEPVNDIPCFICPYARKCDSGQDYYNPRSCAYLTDWLICSIQGEEYTANPFHPEYDESQTDEIY